MHRRARRRGTRIKFDINLQRGRAVFCHPKNRRVLRTNRKREGRVAGCRSEGHRIGVTVAITCVANEVLIVGSGAGLRGARNQIVGCIAVANMAKVAFPVLNTTGGGGRAGAIQPTRERFHARGIIKTKTEHATLGQNAGGIGKGERKFDRIAHVGERNRSVGELRLSLDLPTRRRCNAKL